MTIDWKRFAEIVQQNEYFVLTSHMRADCDAIGSELAMAHALRSLGKQVRIINGDEVPPHIAFIDPNNEVETYDRYATTMPVDVHMILDTSAWSQLGPMADVFRGTEATKVIVDHHVSSDDMGAEEFKDTSAGATGQLVLDACRVLGVKVSPAMATALFAAIATDTGWFRFSSVNAATYAAVSKIVEAGAKPAEIFSQLYEQHSLERLHLHGRVQTAAKMECKGRLIHSHVSLQDFVETGAEPTDTEDVVNRLLTVAGVEVAILFVEIETNLTKASLRSRSDFDVRQVAAKFGGGGHVAASGLKFPGTFADAQKAVLDAMQSAMG